MELNNKRGLETQTYDDQTNLPNQGLSGTHITQDDYTPDESARERLTLPSTSRLNPPSILAHNTIQAYQYDEPPQYIDDQKVIFKLPKAANIDLASTLLAFKITIPDKEVIQNAPRQMTQGNATNFYTPSYIYSLSTIGIAAAIERVEVTCGGRSISVIDDFASYYEATYGSATIQDQMFMKSQMDLGMYDYNRYYTEARDPHNDCGFWKQPNIENCNMLPHAGLVTSSISDYVTSPIQVRQPGIDNEIRNYLGGNKQAYQIHESLSPYIAQGVIPLTTCIQGLAEKIKTFPAFATQNLFVTFYFKDLNTEPVVTPAVTRTRAFHNMSGDSRTNVSLHYNFLWPDKVLNPGTTYENRTSKPTYPKISSAKLVTTLLHTPKQVNDTLRAQIDQGLKLYSYDEPVLIKQNKSRDQQSIHHQLNINDEAVNGILAFQSYRFFDAYHSTLMYGSRSFGILPPFKDLNISINASEYFTTKRTAKELLLETKNAFRGTFDVVQHLRLSPRLDMKVTPYKYQNELMTPDQFNFLKNDKTWHTALNPNTHQQDIVFTPYFAFSGCPTGTNVPQAVLFNRPYIMAKAPLTLEGKGQELPDLEGITTITSENIAPTSYSGETLGYEPHSHVSYYVYLERNAQLTASGIHIVTA